VRVVSVTQQIDLAGTVGHLVAGVLFALADIAWQQVKERQAGGISLAKQRGVYKGRKRGTFTARPERARELRKKGMSLSEIAQALQVDRRTVTRYLKSEPS
jgi:DNA invertase Pin-like site-specific DNA recombinase